MACNEALRVQAYFDGEMDAAAAAEIEPHLNTCRACGELFASLQTTRNAVRQDALYHRAEFGLRSKLAEALDEESGQRPTLGRRFAKGKPFWSGAVSGAAAMALAASLALFVLLPPAS